MSSTAHAHVSGFTDTSIQIAATGVRIIYSVPADNLLELAGDPGKASPSSALPVVYLERVKAGWQVEASGERCLLSQALSRTLEAVGSHQYQFTFVCPAGMRELSIRYSLFFEKWPDHENFVRVFMAGQRQRMRFTAEQPTLSIPVADLLRQWGSSLASGFFDSDPNYRFSLDAQAPDNPVPGIQEVQPSLGRLQLSQVDPGFVSLGVKHIFAGFDHVLFIVGLVMLARRGRELLALVTAFTVAHAVTMALSTLGILRLDPRWTEPMIALTIVYIGVENLLMLYRVRDAGTHSRRSAHWRRIGLVFVFGLIHGVGFSYVLREMGLREDLLGALLYFNAGVELGQIGIIAVTLPALLLWDRARWGRHFSVAVSAAVTLIGAALLVTRL